MMADLTQMAMVSAAAPTKNIELRKSQPKFLIQFSEFLRVSAIKFHGFVQLGVTLSRGIRAYPLNSLAAARYTCPMSARPRW